MNSVPTYFLVGPTAVGKSRIAQIIAETDGFDIISADSMLVYKGMDIGTAKPSPAERKRVRHWGVDLAHANSAFNASDYLIEAKAAIKTISAEQHKQALVVGGTGLYIKGLTHGLTAAAPPDPELRARLEELLNTSGLGALQSLLRETNAELYESLADKENPRRLVRALENASAATGDRPSSWKSRDDLNPTIVGLTYPRELLRTRIEQRVHQMYEEGLLEEVRQLLADGFSDSQTARQAIGYAEAIDCIGGSCSRAEAIVRTIIRTNQLAKRQMTWFRRQCNVDWISIENHTDDSSIITSVKEAWQRHGPTPIVTN